MKGARKYATLIPTGQYGKLYIASSSHARGYTFKIQVLPEGEAAIPNFDNLATNKNAVLVYGMVCGQAGWTEEYGWLHEGPWQEDFEKLVKEKTEKIEDKAKADALREVTSKKEEDRRVRNLLNKY